LILPIGIIKKNRTDCFIIYKSIISSVPQNLVKETIKPYIDSFSSKCDNYTILLYIESSYADTSYI